MSKTAKRIEVIGPMAPPHTGELIRRQVVEPLGLTVSESADALGVARPNLSRLLNGQGAGRDGQGQPDGQAGAVSQGRPYRAAQAVGGGYSS